MRLVPCSQKACLHLLQLEVQLKAGFVKPTSHTLGTQKSPRSLPLQASDAQHKTEKAELMIASQRRCIKRVLLLFKSEGKVLT